MGIRLKINQPIRNLGKTDSASGTLDCEDSYTQQWFFFTILYLVLDYSRIYVSLHLGFMRPLLIVTLILSFFLLTKGRYYLAKSEQTTLLWLFIVLLAVYVPLVRNNHFAFVTFKAQLLYMPFILSVIISVNSVERLKKFIFACICIEVYIALYAITHSGYGPGNYFADENDLALYINMWIPFCYFLFWTEKKLKIRLLYLIGLITGLFAVVASFSRGGFAGLIAICGTVMAFSTRKVQTIVVLCVLACIIVYYAGDFYWNEISTTTNYETGTAKGRIESWKAAWKMFLDNPLGVGGGNFPVRFPEYQTDYFQRGMWGRVAHSLWFTLLPELGIFGVFIFFGLLYYNLEDCFKLVGIKCAKDEEDQGYLSELGKCFLGSIIGYLVAGSFLAVLYYAHYWYLTGIIVATTKVADNLSKSW